MYRGRRSKEGAQVSSGGSHEGRGQGAIGGGFEELNQNSVESSRECNGDELGERSTNSSRSSRNKNGGFGEHYREQTKSSGEGNRGGLEKHRSNSSRSLTEKKRGGFGAYRHPSMSSIEGKRGGVGEHRNPSMSSIEGKRGGVGEHRNPSMSSIAGKRGGVGEHRNPSMSSIEGKRGGVGEHRNPSMSSVEGKRGGVGEHRNPSMSSIAGKRGGVGEHRNPSMSSIEGKRGGVGEHRNPSMSSIEGKRGGVGEHKHPPMTSIEGKRGGVGEHRNPSMSSIDGKRGGVGKHRHPSMSSIDGKRGGVGEHRHPPMTSIEGKRGGVGEHRNPSMSSIEGKRGGVGEYRRQPPMSSIDGKRGGSGKHPSNPSRSPRDGNRGGFEKHRNSSRSPRDGKRGAFGEDQREQSNSSRDGKRGGFEEHHTSPSSSSRDGKRGGLGGNHPTQSNSSRDGKRGGFGEDQREQSSSSRGGNREGCGEHHRNPSRSSKGRKQRGGFEEFHHTNCSPREGHKEFSRESLPRAQTEENKRCLESFVEHNSSLPRSQSHGNVRGGRRGHMDSSKGQEQVRKRFIGYHKLKSWAMETDPDQLVLLIVSETDSLFDLLKDTEMKTDWYTMLVKICRIIVSVNHQKQALKKVLIVFVTSHFLGQTLFHYVNQKKKKIWPDADKFFEDLLIIFKGIVNILPQYADKCLMPLSLLKEIICNTDELTKEKNHLLALHEILKGVREIESTNKGTFARKALTSPDTDSPPEDFRELSVIPQASDLNTDTEPFVRAIIPEGAYEDDDHYLDVQFRLMREDFLRPLREGIHEFRIKGCRKDFKSSDIRFYFDVRIVGLTTVNEISHVLEFNNKSLMSVDWEKSKRLMRGSLLCLSKDNFKTVYFAIVGFRDPKHLKDGIINVEFKSGLKDIFSTSSSELFVMAETAAFFEAYRPVLEGLKEMNSSFAFQEYLIYCQKTLKPPKYLLGGVRKYDLSSLTKTGKLTSVAILNTMKWPTVDKMNLNESQREAVQLALTKELAIIQGPPGTGKTYVGLKVMKVLLENQSNMAGSNDNQLGPILVVCFTNHALDQFLEGVLEFCPKGIVRVGGRSSSESLNKMNLKVLAQSQNSKSVRTALWDTRNTLKTISDAIGILKSKIDSLCHEIKSEKVLKEFMSSKHHNSLQNQAKDVSVKREHLSQTRLWLNAVSTLSRDILPQLIKNRLTDLVLKMPTALYLSQKHFENLDGTLKTMKIFERACVYKGWLEQFLFMQRQPMFRTNFTFVQCMSRILPDSEMETIIPATVFQFLHKYKIKSVETWVLGLGKSLNKQLQDISILTKFYSKSGQIHDERIDLDNVDEIVGSHNDWLIDSDKDEEEKIAAAVKTIKDGDAFLLHKAEKLGIRDYDDDDGKWHTVTYRKSISFSKLTYYLKFIEPMTEEEEEDVDDIWSLEIKERFALYNLWIRRYQSELVREMESLFHEYEEALKGKNELRMSTDINILKKASVIGMTTTGAAKHRTLLQAVACQIIIVEEAAEVLEAHVITALNKNCKHLILIGDHQQLKPNPTVYALAKHYHLDLSLFERLIKNGIHHVTLEEQHRMRTSISKIMRHIYPNLQDHISVTKYDDVRGIQKNIFFINHAECESNVGDTKSKSNAHEASYLVALLKYLLNQGYEPSQITILATYVGQMSMLKRRLEDTVIGDAKGLRVTTVDNYQGEENDIILLSLVRSNTQNSAGFLKVDNRVCVALSRAKKGMYVIGNFEMLYSQSKLWRKIVDTAELDNIYGNGLPLACPNHPNTKVEVSLPEDFEKQCPEGGCQLQCKSRLKCGHACHLKCHGYDFEHENVRCIKMCTKSCDAGHPCKKKCIQDCGDCRVVVEKTIPRCGHTNELSCYIPVEKAICNHPCPVFLDCKHQCSGICGQCDENKEHAECKTQVEYFWPCGHICKVPCYMKPSDYPCPKKCEAILECGHECEGTCSKCVDGMFHVACQKKCDQYLPCGHRCSSLCSIPCPPCPKYCNLSCRHSKCASGNKGHRCGETCIPCKENCLYHCKHFKCSKKCCEECDIEPCNRKCKRQVSQCKHSCSGLCGELCVCAQCEPVSVLPQKTVERDFDEKKTTMSPSKQMSEQKKIEDLFENLKICGSSVIIKIPSCGHIFYVNELDGYVKSLQANDNCLCLPCPICKKDIQNCFRYIKIIRAKNYQLDQKKKKILINNKLTSKQAVDISRSQEMLDDVDLSRSWCEITKISTHSLNKPDIMSLNCKCKYALVLTDLQLLDKQSKLDAELTQIISAVKSMDGVLTKQQKSDFQIGLKYFLLNIYINTSDMTVILKSSNVEKYIATAKAALKKGSKYVAQQMLTISFSTIQAMTEKSKATNGISFPLAAARKMVSRDWKILDSVDYQMLCDFLDTKSTSGTSDTLTDPRKPLSH